MSEHVPVGADQRLVVGWREWMALPQLGIPAIRVKIDSGARSSALHVHGLECFQRGGREHVRFSLHPGREEDPQVSGCEAEVVDRRKVTDSGGHTSERVFIHTLLAVAGVEFRIEINLTDRRNMLFPMLLGRTAMAGRMLVDPDLSFVLGEPPSHLAPAAVPSAPATSQQRPR